MSPTRFYGSNGPPKPSLKPHLDRPNGVPNSGLKTIVSKPSTTSTRLPQTRSSGPPKSFPLLEDVIKHPAKKSATKSAKKPTTSPLQKTKKPTKKREALKQVEEVEEAKKKRMRKAMSSPEKYVCRKLWFGAK